MWVGEEGIEKIFRCELLGKGRRERERVAIEENLLDYINPNFPII